MAQANPIVTDVSRIDKFEPHGDVNSVGIRWTRWARAFELFAVGKGIVNPAQKKALLLHEAGMEVQDIFYTLEVPEPGQDEDVYGVALATLNTHFTPQVNHTFERSQFRAMTQTATETVEQFITRLRQKAVYCNFTDIDESIRDQVIEKCYSQRLRRKLLERNNVTLQQLREMAQSLEAAEKRAVTMEHKPEPEAINKVSRYKQKQDFKQQDKKCYSCGKFGHYRTDSKCPARGQKCRKCHMEGHFEVCCKTKPKSKWQKNKKAAIRNIETHDLGSDEEEKTYVFTIQNRKCAKNDFSVSIGGIQTEVIIDSGATVNVIDRDLWEQLKQQKVKCQSQSKSSSRKLYPYGSNKPLTVAGSFVTDVCTQNCCVSAEFFVVEESGQALLGYDTSTQLGVLQIQDVNSIAAVHTGSRDIKTEMLEKFPKVFEGLGKLKNFQLQIPIDESVHPVSQTVRRVPYHVRSKLDEKLDELENMDVIEKVRGPSRWVSPIVVVPKKNADIRICVDMRRANEAVIRERYQIPTVDEILQDLNQSRVYSKLDIKWAYHQLELTPDSREITTFMTPRGLYRYKRLLFGVSCAPEMYNKIIQQTLGDLPGVNAIYDDVVVHGTTELEHRQNLEMVLKRLEDSGMTLNIDKCQFNMEKIDFMGYVLSEHGIGIAESKVEAIRSARTPQSVSEVRSFLGLVNFAGRFIPNLSTIAEPLNRLLRKDQSFVWEPEQNEAFDKLKDCLANVSTLAYFDINAKTQVIADASPVGLGAVLVQEQQGKPRIISYASRSLSDIERRYAQTEKEALSLVWACERFHMYLMGKTFELLTDHKPLEFIFSPKSKPCARVERWLLRMQNYSYTVRHIPGTSNIADSLSRMLSATEVNSKVNDTEEYLRFVVEEAVPNAMTVAELERASLEDEEFRNLRECLVSGKWYQLQQKEYLTVKSELCVVGHLILRGTRIVIPKLLRDQVLALGHEGHPGIVIMKQRLRSKVWWPKMDRDIEQWSKACYGCQLVSQPEKVEPMTRTELPSRPWEHLAADFLGPLPSGDYIFAIVDYYSRWIDLAVMKSTTAEKMVDSLKQIFSTHGLPVSITTDNGPQFVSDHFKTYCEVNGIVHRKTTPLWPQANGEIERQNRSILKRLKIAQAEKKDWKSELQTYLMMYRSAPHTTTGVSPAELLFNRVMRTKLPDIHKYSETDYYVRDRDAEKKAQGKIYSDAKRGATPSNIQPGDFALMKKNKENKLSATYHSDPFKVVEKNGNSVVLESKEGVQYKRNVSHVKKFVNPKSFVNVSSENVNEKLFSENLIPSGNSCDEICTPSDVQETPSVNSSAEETEDGVQDQTKTSPQISRPVRQRCLPAKFKDFVMN